MENDICNVDNIGSDDNASEVNANNTMDKEVLCNCIVIEKLSHGHPRASWALFIFLAIFSPSAQVHKCSHSDAQTLSKMVGWVIHPWDHSILIGS